MAKSPNPYHDMDIDEFMATVEIRDASGKLVERPERLDPDWLEHMEHPEAPIMLQEIGEVPPQE